MIRSPELLPNMNSSSRPSALLLALVCIVAAVNASAPRDSSATPSLQYKVCGEYCGPDWCSGDVIDETACVQGGVWGVPSEPGQCADACCRAHDYCCGTAADRPTCNNKLLTCLTSSNCYRTSICGAATWAAMKIVTNWCCGSKCPVSTMLALETALGLNSTEVAELRLANEALL